MEVGKFTYGTENIRVFTWGEKANLIIGSFCSIAENVKIFLGGEHRTDWLTTYPFGHINQSIFNKFNGVGIPITHGDVIIGNDVWLCANITIMSGVKVGDGAIIANNSHVVKDVEPYTIVGGNPAKLIRKRFSDEIISKLLEIKWWNLDNNLINELSPYLSSGNFDLFIEKYNSLGITKGE